MKKYCTPNEDIARAIARRHWPLDNDKWQEGLTASIKAALDDKDREFWSTFWDGWTTCLGHYGLLEKIR